LFNTQSPPEPRVQKFTHRILTYLDEEGAKIPTGQAWLATSDIVESIFGKSKSFTARGPLKEMGQLLLMIPAFVTEPSSDLLRKAMETVRTLDVKRWVKEHFGPSMLARRIQALRSPVRDTETA
jgi:hypothetical protein